MNIQTYTLTDIDNIHSTPKKPSNHQTLQSKFTKFLQSTHNDSSDKPKLHRTFFSQFMTTEQIIQRNVLSILNKLNTQNSQTLIKEMCTFIQTQKQIEFFIEMLFKKAINENKFCKLYVKFFCDVKKFCLENNLAPQNDRMIYSRLLVEKSKQIFEDKKMLSQELCVSKNRTCSINRSDDAINRTLQKDDAINSSVECSIESINKLNETNNLNNVEDSTQIDDAKNSSVEHSIPLNDSKNRTDTKNSTSQNSTENSQEEEYQRELRKLEFFGTIHVISELYLQNAVKIQLPIICMKELIGNENENELFLEAFHMLFKNIWKTMKKQLESEENILEYSTNPKGDTQQNFQMFTIEEKKEVLKDVEYIFERLIFFVKNGKKMMCRRIHIILELLHSTISKEWNVLQAKKKFEDFVFNKNEEQKERERKERMKQKKKLKNTSSISKNRNDKNEINSSKKKDSKKMNQKKKINGKKAEMKDENSENVEKIEESNENNENETIEMKDENSMIEMKKDDQTSKNLYIIVGMLCGVIGVLFMIYWKYYSVSI